MLFGNKSVLDPSTAMKSVIDSQGRQSFFFKNLTLKGNKVKIGEQSDITEFSINFFERIEEGLTLDARVKIFHFISLIVLAQKRTRAK